MNANYRDIVREARVSNAGTSEGVKKAWETRREHNPGDTVNVHGIDYRFLTAHTPGDHHALGRHNIAAMMEKNQQTHDIMAVRPKGGKVHTFVKFASGNFSKPKALPMSMKPEEVEDTITKAKAELSGIKTSNRASYFDLISSRIANGRAARYVERAVSAGLAPTRLDLLALAAKAEVAGWNDAIKNDAHVFDDDRIGNSDLLSGPCCKLPACMSEKICNRFALPADGWIHVASRGEHPHPKGLIQVLDDQGITEMVNKFREEAKDPRFVGLLVDKDHVSQTGTTEASGWIVNLQERKDGLWANVAWTDQGKRDVESGAFRMTSPVWRRSDCVPVDGKPNNYCRPIRLDSLALTNDPNIKNLTPISKIV